LAAAPQPGGETPAALFAMLKATPAVFDALGRDLPAEKWNITPHAEEWCFTEILCHLRDADREVNLPRFERMSIEENAFLPGVNVDAWSETRSYCSEDGRAAQEGFIHTRQELVAQLSALSTEQWQQTARHAIFGPTTLKELVTFIAQHDRTHIQQALQTVRGL